ncbi:MAG TPA: ribosomal protein L7/L12, partial [Woeseiaceae bacterium]|nr:ribosomal protein L7/L12 [Woeseiaceae bacterium]
CPHYTCSIAATENVKCPVSDGIAAAFETCRGARNCPCAIFFAASVQLMRPAQKQENANSRMKTKAIITDDDLPPAVIRAIQQGRKIEAIKLLRESTGLGLANAKVLVDKAARHHAPKKAAPPIVEEQSSVGRLLTALLLVVLAFAFYRYYAGP